MTRSLHHNHSTTLTSFERDGAVIVPDDAVDLPIKAVVVTDVTGGDILSVVPVLNGDGEPIVFTGVHVGFSPPYLVRRVMAATTCGVASVGIAG